jgi:hypothetical protein
MSLRKITISLLISGIAAGCGFPPLPNAVPCATDGSCPTGQRCEADLHCHPAMPDAPVSTMDAAGEDAPAPTIDAAPPDVPAVACSGDSDCQTPPNLCAKPGICDLSVNKCVFPPVDCSEQNTCGPFGSCQNANPQDICDSGSKSQTCMDFTCQPSTGACVGSARIVTVDCSGITDGRACGTDGQQLSCTSCNYADVCDTEASQSCTFVDEKCQNDVCIRQPDEMRNLTCSRSGPANPLDACGPPTASNCGPCRNPSNVCAPTGGEQQCTITHHGCVNGACGSTSGTGSQSCTPDDQENQPCGFCGAGQGGDVVCLGGVCTNRCIDCIRDGDGVPFC